MCQLFCVGACAQRCGAKQQVTCVKAANKLLQRRSAVDSPLIRSAAYVPQRRVPTLSRAWHSPQDPPRCVPLGPTVASTIWRAANRVRFPICEAKTIND